MKQKLKERKKKKVKQSVEILLGINAQGRKWSLHLLMFLTQTSVPFCEYQGPGQR